MRKILVILLLLLSVSYARAQYVWTSNDGHSQYITVEYDASDVNDLMLREKHRPTLNYMIEVLKSVKGGLSTGQYMIWVESYVSQPGNSTQQNRQIASNLSNLVKGFAISNAGVREENFSTRNYCGTFNNSRAVTTVVIGMRYPLETISSKQKIDFSDVTNNIVSNDSSDPTTEEQDNQDNQSNIDLAIKKVGFDTTVLFRPKAKNVSFENQNAMIQPVDDVPDLYWGDKPSAQPKTGFIAAPDDFPSLFGSSSKSESSTQNANKAVDGRGFYIVEDRFGSFEDGDRGGDRGDSQARTTVVDIHQSPQQESGTIIRLPSNNSIPTSPYDSFDHDAPARKSIHPTADAQQAIAYIDRSTGAVVAPAAKPQDSFDVGAPIRKSIHPEADAQQTSAYIDRTTGAVVAPTSKPQDSFDVGAPVRKSIHPEVEAQQTTAHIDRKAGTVVAPASKPHDSFDDNAPVRKPIHNDSKDNKSQQAIVYIDRTTGAVVDAPTGAPSTAPSGAPTASTTPGSANVVVPTPSDAPSSVPSQGAGTKQTTQSSTPGKLGAADQNQNSQAGVVVPTDAKSLAQQAKAEEQAKAVQERVNQQLAKDKAKEDEIAKRDAERAAVKKAKEEKAAAERQKVIDRQERRAKMEEEDRARVRVTSAQLDVLSVDELRAMGVDEATISEMSTKKLGKSTKSKSGKGAKGKTEDQPVVNGKTPDGKLVIDGKSVESSINKELAAKQEVADRKSRIEQERAIRELARKRLAEINRKAQLAKGRFAVASVGVNALSTLALKPGIEAAAYFGNNFSASVEWYYSKWNYTPKNIFNVSMASAELRYFVMAKHKKFDGLYVGINGGMGEYDFRWATDEGRQSQFWTVGLSVGYVLPLGKSGFYMDAGISAGYVSEKMNKYFSFGGYYFDQGTMTNSTFFAPTKIKVSFIYRLFNQKKSREEK